MRLLQESWRGREAVRKLRSIILAGLSSVVVAVEEHLRCTTLEIGGGTPQANPLYLPSAAFFLFTSWVFLLFRIPRISSIDPA